MPSNVRRVCFTIWMSKKKLEGEDLEAKNVAKQEARRAVTQMLARAQSLSPDEALDLILNDELRPYVCRLALADEWVQSLVDSHPKEQSDVLVARFAQELQIIMRAVGPAMVAARVYQENWDERVAKRRIEWF